MSGGHLIYSTPQQVSLQQDNQSYSVYLSEYVVEAIHLNFLLFFCSLLCLEKLPGGILKPMVAGSNQTSIQHPEKLVSDDLDSSLANLVGSKCLSIGLINKGIHLINTV